MGYTTHFEGEFKLDRPMQPEHVAYLNAFADSRRMCRDRKITATFPDPIRLAVGLPVGTDGQYHVADLGSGSIKHNDDFLAATGVVAYNSPPGTQPGLWCDWVPSADGTAIVWNGSDKFYNYVEWLRWLIRQLLAPWGYVLNGTVVWYGENPYDHGKMEVSYNKLRVRKGRDEYIPIYTLEEAIHAATTLFRDDDAIVQFLDNRSYCTLADMSALVAALPADERSARRFIVGIGDLTEPSTDAVVSKVSIVAMLPLNSTVLYNGNGGVDEAIPLFRVQSIEFLRAADCLDLMRRTRPVALGESGIKLKSIPKTPKKSKK